MVQPALQAAAALALEGVELGVMNARFVKPLDRELILALAATGFLVTVEENVLQGGFGTSILELLEESGVNGVRVVRLGYPDRFIEQGEQAELKAAYGLDAAGIAKSVREARGAGGEQRQEPAAEAPLDDPTDPSDRTDLSDHP
jgi:1-deoxy-D-xylulose-5-phosphate synthase